MHACACVCVRTWHACMHVRTNSMSLNYDYKGTQTCWFRIILKNIHHFLLPSFSSLLYSYIKYNAIWLHLSNFIPTYGTDFEFCCSNKCYSITVFKRTSLCLAFMFLISLMICVSRNLRNALSWHWSGWKNRDKRSVGVNRFLLRSSIKARHKVCKRGQKCLQSETLNTIHDKTQTDLVTNFIK